MHQGRRGRVAPHGAVPTAWLWTFEPLAWVLYVSASRQEVNWRWWGAVSPEHWGRGQRRVLAHLSHAFESPLNAFSRSRSAATLPDIGRRNSRHQSFRVDFVCPRLGDAAGWHDREKTKLLAKMSVRALRKKKRERGRDSQRQMPHLVLTICPHSTRKREGPVLAWRGG